MNTVTLTRRGIEKVVAAPGHGVRAIPQIEAGEDANAIFQIALEPGDSIKWHLIQRLSPEGLRRRSGFNGCYGKAVTPTDINHLLGVKASSTLGVPERRKDDLRSVVTNMGEKLAHADLQDGGERCG